MMFKGFRTLFFFLKKKMTRTDQNVINQITELTAQGIKSKDIQKQLTNQGIKIGESTVRRYANSGSASKNNSFEEPAANGFSNLFDPAEEKKEETVWDSFEEQYIPVREMPQQEEVLKELDKPEISNEELQQIITEEVQKSVDTFGAVIKEDKKLTKTLNCMLQEVKKEKFKSIQIFAKTSKIATCC